MGESDGERSKVKSMHGDAARIAARTRAAGPAQAPVPTQLLILLCLAFIVSVGFGVVAPVLPAVIERLRPALRSEELAWHTGLITGLYTFMAFAFGRLWGQLSDRIGRRPVLLAAAGGYVLALAAFPLAVGLSGAYVLRAVAGAFSAGVLPVVLAWIGDTSPDMLRARHYALASMASLLGFLVGPMLGGALTGEAATRIALAFGLAPDTLALPFLASAGLGSAVWLAAWAKLGALADHAAQGGAARPLAKPNALPPAGALIGLSAAIAFALGSFEVGLILFGRQQLALDPPEIARMFVECSLVMIVVQAALAAGLFRRLRPAPIMTACVAVLGVAFALLPYAGAGFGMSLAIAGIAGAAGALMPLLSYWISLHSEEARGAGLGAQASSTSLGQALGSAGAGGLFGLAIQAPFWSAAAVVLATWLAFASFRPEARASGGS
jgi:MFS family permease